MSLLEKFVAEGNEKADELAKESNDAGWRFLWRRQGQARSSMRGKKSVRSFAVCSQHSLLGGRMERLRGA